MSARTLKALRASISHWERMKSGKRKNKEKPTAAYCSLCKITNEACDGCPVAEHTGHAQCFQTPWRKAFNAFFIKGPKSIQFKEAATEEIQFLKSLLPTKKGPKA